MYNACTKENSRDLSAEAGEPGLGGLQDRHLLLGGLEPGALLVDDLLGGVGDEGGVAELGAEALASLSSLSSAFASRSRSAAMSMTSASGRQKVAPSHVRVTAPFGASAAVSKRSTRASRATSGRLRSSASACAGGEVERDQGDAGAGGHVHLGADRADFLDQADHPAHLGVGRGVDQLRAIGRPVGVDEQLRRASPIWPQSSSVMKGMNGCIRIMHWSSTQAMVARVSARRSPSNSGLANSTYQSQTLPQTKA